MTDQRNKSNILKETLPLVLGEILAVLLVTLGGLALGMAGVITFNAYIVSGAILGALVTVINYLVLTLSVDLEIKKYLELRGDKEMSEEEAEEFAKTHTQGVQKAVARSSVLRTFSIVACLLVAFLTGVFNPIATIIPLLAYRPILTVAELIKAKNEPAPNPEKYIKYKYKDENDEKESD